MANTDIDELNKRFGINSNNSQVSFSSGEGGIPVIEVVNEQAKALISMQGAHLLSWIPAGEDEVIWVSEDAQFKPGKSIRGGVPICWPWFGAHENNATFPAHGFARTVLWELVETAQLESGETKIIFKLDVNKLDDEIKKMCSAKITAEYSVTIGSSLKFELTTINASEDDIVIGEALHTYFNVGDITDVRVTGLDGKDYLDKTDGFKRKKQNGDMRIAGEVDRVYLQTTDDVFIKNKQRTLCISKQGSHSTVVWNPGKLVAEKMGDLGDEGYIKMLCVESANAAEDVVVIPAGQSHRLDVNYKL